MKFILLLAPAISLPDMTPIPVAEQCEKPLESGSGAFGACQGEATSLVFAALFQDVPL
jgi:hypothetical protein